MADAAEAATLMPLLEKHQRWVAAVDAAAIGGGGGGPALLENKGSAAAAGSDRGERAIVHVAFVDCHQW